MNLTLNVAMVQEASSTHTQKSHTCFMIDTFDIELKYDSVMHVINLF